MDNELYITSEVNENITLTQRSGGLLFGSDAFLLYAYMKKAPRSVGAELGAGSGIVSLLALAKKKLAKIYAAEVQEPYARLIARNAEENGFGDSLIPLHANVRDITACDTSGEVDVAFTNPPYMKNGSGRGNDNREKLIARHEVLGNIGDFTGCAARLLKYGGAFYAVYRPERLTDLFEAMRKSSLEPKRMTLVYPDAASRPCLALIEGKKGASPGLFTTMPLIMHDNASVLPVKNSPELEYIYKEGEFDERFRVL